MFDSVELRGFGGVRDCERPVKLHKFTVLIGPNNSCKTTLLIGLSLLPYPWYQYLPLISMHRSRFLGEFLYKDLSSLVYRYSGRGEVKCVFNSKNLMLEVYEDRVDDLLVGDGEGEKMERIPYTMEEKLVKYFKLELKKLIEYTLFIPNSDAFRRRLESMLVEHWESIEKTGAHVKLVRRLVSKVVEDRFTEITLRRRELMLRKVLPDEDVAYIRMGDMGDGVKRFLTAALWLEAVKPRVVLWDDLESSAHPALIRAVIEWLADHDWQVVASTHSIDVLREIVLARPKEARVLSLRKLEDDTLLYREYELEKLEQMFERGLDVRKLLA